MTDYLLRTIPNELWKEARKRAIDEGISTRELILKAIESYISKPPSKKESK